MADNNTTPNIIDEEIIHEWPKYTLWLEANTASRGNLILTNERLVFLKEKVLTENDVVELSQLRERKASIREEIRFALGMQRKNFQIPLEDIIRASLGVYSILPFRLCLYVHYTGKSNKPRQLTFLFTMSFFSRIILKDFPTLGWWRTINSEVKRLRKRHRDNL
jgi:hypothetical protein